MNMLRPILYTATTSPGGRAVLFAAKYLNVDLDIREIETGKGEHLTPQFLKLNPQHTIPVLDDNGKILCDSHAIATYLVNKHDANHKLYPQDPYERACVDQRLYFDASTLFPIYKKCVRKIKFAGAFEQTDEDIGTFRDACDAMETFLGRGAYIAGERLSLADFFVAGTLMQMEKIVPVDYEKYVGIRAWQERLAELPEFYELNTKHVERYAKSIAGVIEKNLQAATSKQ